MPADPSGEREGMRTWTTGRIATFTVGTEWGRELFQARRRSVVRNGEADGRRVVEFDAGRETRTNQQDRPRQDAGATRHRQQGYVDGGGSAADGAHSAAQSGSL